MRLQKRSMLLAGLLVLLVSLHGCAPAGSKVCPIPVVDEAAQLDKQLSKDLIDDHVYFSKEGSSGGRSFGGGGCGCN